MDLFFSLLSLFSPIKLFSSTNTALLRRQKTSPLSTSTDQSHYNGDRRMCFFSSHVLLMKHNPQSVLLKNLRE